MIDRSLINRSRSSVEPLCKFHLAEISRWENEGGAVRSAKCDLSFPDVHSDRFAANRSELDMPPEVKENFRYTGNGSSEYRGKRHFVAT